MTSISERVRQTPVLTGRTDRQTGMRTVYTTSAFVPDHALLIRPRRPHDQHVLATSAAQNGGFAPISQAV